MLGFGAALLLAEAVWRIGQHCLNRVGALGMEHLYVLGMDELLAKDAAFFHDNFSGSLTKRVLSFGRRFEDFVDTMTYRIVAASCRWPSAPSSSGTTNRCSSPVSS
ncbi:hypothetical protein GCM10023238_32630 [Streptomyces heliomycini]